MTNNNDLLAVFINRNVVLYDMSNQALQKVAIFAILVSLVLALGMYQQALAQFCGNSGCYSYPQQKEPSVEFILGQNLNPDNGVTITGI